MKNKAKIARELTAAAERIASGRDRYCCDALGYHLGKRGDAYLIFKETFLRTVPKYGFGLQLWWHDEDQESRVLALLLAAELVRSGSPLPVR